MSTQNLKESSKRPTRIGEFSKFARDIGSIYENHMSIFWQ